MGVGLKERSETSGLPVLGVDRLTALEVRLSPSRIRRYDGKPRRGKTMRPEWDEFDDLIKVSERLA